jgi:hypothetical protein
MRVHVCIYVRAHMYVASTWLSFVSSSSNIQGVWSFIDLFRPRRPRDLRDRFDSHNLSYSNANLTYKWYILLSQTRRWRPSHGGITIISTSEEIPMHKPVWRLKASSPSNRLLTDRLGTCHEEVLIPASLRVLCVFFIISSHIQTS